MIDEVVTPESGFYPGMGYRVRRQINRWLNDPLNGAGNQLWVGTHHKTGTNWLRKIFEELAFTLGLRFSARWHRNMDLHTDIFFDHHSSLKPEKDQVRGVHVIRDPRDIIISGYHYHLWTSEAWAHVPLRELDGMTYQQKLNSVDKYAGLLLEVDRCEHLFTRMEEWDYTDSRFLEVKYEELIRNDQEQFAAVFRFMGWKEASLPKALAVVEKHSFKNATNRKVGEAKAGEHLRSGKPGEWKEELTKDHLDYFSAKYPSLLTSLNY